MLGCTVLYHAALCAVLYAELWGARDKLCHAMLCCAELCHAVRLFTVFVIQIRCECGAPNCRGYLEAETSQLREPLNGEAKLIDSSHASSEQAGVADSLVVSMSNDQAINSGKLASVRMHALSVVLRHVLWSNTSKSNRMKEACLHYFLNNSFPTCIGLHDKLQYAWVLCTANL